MTEPTSDTLGPDMLALARRLFPICRSITGEGLRETLRIIGEHVPLKMTEIATGTAAFDWTIPKEWNLRRATLRGPDGTILADSEVNNLHVVNYSVPVRAKLSLAQLRSHLHSLPEKPSLIPYRTAYYAPTWGFCLPHDVVATLADGVYQIEIDSTLADGSLTLGECVIAGDSEEEVLLGCHCCHPSLANDNLSGIVVATMLARELASRQTMPRFTYRFLFNPGTIGSIAWLARNHEITGRIRHGVVLSCLGDSGAMTYKKSRRGNADIDRIAAHVLNERGEPHRVVEFSPYGYDERQYCSPGFDLPVGVLMRTPNGQYPEYHTSADNLELLRETSLVDSLAKLRRMVQVIEANETYINLNPHCEPQLGKRGLYNVMGGSNKPPGFEMALLWVLNQSDGAHDLLSIAQRAQIPFDTIALAGTKLREAGLLRAAKKLSS